MTAAYTTPEAISEEYKQTGQRYIRQADAEFDKGDFLQLPMAHLVLSRVKNHIVSETGWRQIRPLFAVAEGMHANFYEAWMPGDEIEDGIESVKELLTLLENIPPPNGDNPIRPPRARLFIRDRGDDI